MNREPHVEMNESAFDPTEAVRSLRRESAEWLRIVGVGIAIVVGFGAVGASLYGTIFGVFEVADPLFAFVLGIGPFAGPIACAVAIAGLWLGVLRLRTAKRSWLPLVATVFVLGAVGLLMAAATGAAICATWPSAQEQLIAARFGSLIGPGILIVCFCAFLPVRGLKLLAWLLPVVVLLQVDPQLASAFVAFAVAEFVRTVPVSGPAWRLRCARLLWAVGTPLLSILAFAPPSLLAFLSAVPTLTDSAFAAVGIAAAFGIGRCTRRRWIDAKAVGPSWIRAVVVGLFAAAGAVWLARACGEFLPQVERWSSVHDRSTRDSVWFWIFVVWVVGYMAWVVRYDRNARREREQLQIERRSRSPDRLARLFQRRPAFTIGSGLWALLAVPLLVTVLAWNHRVAPFQSTRLLAVDAPIDAMDLDGTDFVALAPVTAIPEGDAFAEAETGARRGFVDLERWGDAYVVHGLRFDGEPHSGSLAEDDNRASVVGFVGPNRTRFQVGLFDGDDEVREWNRTSRWFDDTKGRMSVTELDLGAAVLLRRDPSWPEDWKKRLELAPSARFTLRVTDDGIARADDVTIDGLSIDAWLARR